MNDKTMASSIEDTIHKVEVLYQSLTGCEPPPRDGAYAPVPPEVEPLAHVEEQLARLTNLVVNPEPVATPTWSPPISVWEDNKDFVIDIELAGLSQSEVDIATLRQLLTISGIRKDGSGERRVWLNEQGVGPFRRSVLLPPHADTTRMRVSGKKGMLQIRVPFRTATEHATSSETQERN